MPLTPEQRKAGLEAAKKAEHGDAQCLQFFAGLDPNSQVGKDFLALRDEARGEMSMGGLVPIEMVKALGLNQQQIKDCQRATAGYARGDHQAKAFFAGVERGAAAGIPECGAMLQLRDQILASGKIPEAPAEELQTIEARGPAAAILRSQVVRHAVPGGPVAPGPKVASASPKVALSTPAGQPIPASSLLGISSGIVDTIPPLDTEGAMETIGQAVQEGRVFSHRVVGILMAEIEGLLAYVGEQAELARRLQEQIDLMTVTPEHAPPVHAPGVKLTSSEPGSNGAAS